MSDQPDKPRTDDTTETPASADIPDSGEGSNWAFWGAAVILMLPPLIPIVAAIEPALVPLPIDMTIPDEASGTGWTVFLIGLGAVLLMVNVTVLYALSRWADR